MPHSSSIITAVTNATISTPSSTSAYYSRVSPTLTSTPPPCASPVELAPILDLCDNRPPSPDSPKIKRLSDGVFGKTYYPPSYLEPKPQFVVEPTSNLLFPLHLFTILKETFYSPTHVQIPIPRRRSSSLSSNRVATTTVSPHHQQQQQQQQHHQYQQQQQQRMAATSRIIISPSPSTSSSSTSGSTMGDPMSPTMTAASASAAAAADHRNPGSHLAKSLLKSIPSDTPSKSHKRLADVMYHHTVVHHKNNKSNVDQSMFLTKNAHIKRPRNAWIHFRCHYGQALKAQDPTLRAEEISKRASRRWGKLSEIEKRPWHGLAEQEKLAHREAFPEYRYCPRRATSSSVSPPSPTHNNNRVRSATTGDMNTPLMHDVFSIPTSLQRPTKRVKRNSK
ncbi:uncharacterized protein EV154DRAFT_532753 [Mucor mucedo]|uniref:uncharacterized protein n=1 Tax=Mucor mucedo TaxID=29922 RepID=UPI00221FA1CC|nr:uncharacterized protein EV154DRAFT_532753 [Mucor mucedo]KAI7866216.1 hypothetical protein EV154DRAFT_532753 [Mucor mucedo]